MSVEKISLKYSLSIPRFYLVNYLMSKSTELHGFCDASKMDMLLLSYQEMAPIKKLTIPKIELMSCLLLSQFM